MNDFPDIDFDLLKRTIKKWGKKPQYAMAIEECGELITAISQEWRGRDSNVSEEVADVYIMMIQLRMIIGDEVDKIIKQKLDRLKQNHE